ncbi:MAG: hypothetical protein JWL66_2547 [Sphingomonadales bacterium]|nr:hypothetical protein [Sphingomonadales bacterium]
MSMIVTRGIYLHSFSNVCRGEAEDVGGEGA